MTSYLDDQQPDATAPEAPQRAGSQGRRWARRRRAHHPARQTRDRQSWRLGTLVHEGLSNSWRNPLRTLTLLVAFTAAFTIIGLEKLSHTTAAEHAAEADRRAGRDVGALLSPSTDIATIDSASCASIADGPRVIRGGAVLAQQTVTSNVGVTFPLYTVTIGLLDIVADSHLDLPAVTTPNVILSTALADELALAPDRYITIDQRPLEVVAVADTGVRNPAFARAAFILAPPTGDSTSCVIEGTPGARLVLASQFASILHRQRDATFAFYLSDKDLHRTESFTARSASVLAAAIVVALTLLIHRRFRNAEAAVYTANGCRPLDQWWLSITESAPVLAVATVLAAAVAAGVGDHQLASRAALTDALSALAASAASALTLVVTIAAIPYTGSLLTRLKDRT